MKNLLSKCFIAFLLLFTGAMSFSIAVTQTSLFLALVFWVWICLREKEKPFPRTPLDWFFLAYLAVELVSLAFSPNPLRAFINLKRMLLIPIVYLAAGSVRNKTLLGWTLVSLIGVTVAVSLIGIPKYLLGPGGLEGRLKLFHHYMTSGGILMFVGLIAAAFVFVRAPLKVRIAAAAGAVVILIPLIFTFTRSSWLGFLGGIAVILLCKNWKWILAMVPALVILVWLAPPSVKERLESIYNPCHPNNIERTYLWKGGIRMMRIRPLTGYGDIDLGAVYEKTRPAEAKERSGHMHNNFIQLGATLGIPGLLVMLGLFIQIALVEWKILRSVPPDEWLLSGTALGCFAAFIGFQINGLFEWNFGDAEIAMLLWLSVGWAMAVKRLSAGSRLIHEKRSERRRIRS
jgi:O-antigen ligase